MKLQVWYFKVFERVCRKKVDSVQEERSLYILLPEIKRPIGTYLGLVLEPPEPTPCTNDVRSAPVEVRFHECRPIIHISSNS